MYIAKSMNSRPFTDLILDHHDGFLSWRGSSTLTFTISLSLSIFHKLSLFQSWILYLESEVNTNFHFSNFNVSPMLHQLSLFYLESEVNTKKLKRKMEWKVTKRKSEQRGVGLKIG